MFSWIPVVWLVLKIDTILEPRIYSIDAWFARNDAGLISAATHQVSESPKRKISRPLVFN